MQFKLSRKSNKNRMTEQDNRQIVMPFYFSFIHNMKTINDNEWKVLEHKF